MNKYRDYLKDKLFTRVSLSIVFTAALLCITYFVVRDIGSIANTAWGMISSIIGALSPLWIGLILAYMINPLVDSIDNKLLGRIHFKQSKKDTFIKSEHKKRRFASIIIAYLLLILILVALLYGFASLIMGEFVVKSVSDLFHSVLRLATTYEAEFQKWATHLPSGVFSEYAEEVANTIISWLGENFSASGIVDTVGNISSGIFNFAIGIIVSIYLIADKEFMLNLWKRFLFLSCPNRNGSISRTLGEINNVLSRFIRGVLIDAMFVAVLSSIGLSIMGLKFAVFIGIFAGVANVIPYFGPIMGMIPAFIVGVFTEDFWTGVIAVIVLLIVQQIDSNIIYPRVVGSSTGLRPLFVLLAVTVGGYYGGILGMIIAVPIAGIAQIFIVKWAWKRDEKITGALHGGDE